MSLFYRANGVDSANGAAYTLNGATPVVLSATNYSGLSLAKNASTTLEVGAVLVSGTIGARLSQIGTVITYVMPPVTPTNITSQASTTGIVVSWSSSTNDQDYFAVERSADGVTFTQIGTTLGGYDRSYFDPSLSSGTYYYRVRAHNILGYSDYSSTTVTTLP
jgi:titin